MALNFFKCQILGRKHVPMEPQTEEVLNALSHVGMEETFDPRTWNGWFSKEARRARGDSLIYLDKAALLMPPIDVENDLLYARPGPTFYSKMMEGGLSKELLEPCTTKKAKYALIQRADEYQPLSQWHLHLDAIETVALTDGNGNADWETVKRIGAVKVLSLLHERWNVRDGSIYPSLTSNFRVEYELASETVKEEMRQSCSRMRPNLFQPLMEKAAIPDWSRVKVAVDVGPTQVHRLLFSLAADTDFLVADRFNAWALDLASAALATMALAMTDRYNNFGPTPGPDMEFWDAYEVLFFRNEESQDFIFDSLCLAMGSLDARFSSGSLELLVAAGARYKHAIAQLGIKPEQVLEMTFRCLDIHPLIYGPG